MSYTFKIKAAQVEASYGYGKFFFDKNLGIPGGQGTASHDFMTIEVRREDERKGIQDLFKIGKTYEITIKEAEADE